MGNRSWFVDHGEWRNSYEGLAIRKDGADGSVLFASKEKRTPI